MKKIGKDLTGHKFNRLTVVSFAGSFLRGKSDLRKERRWECLCECGAKHQVSSGNLVSGHVKSCGCFLVDFLKNRTGKSNPCWKGGKTTCSKGYTMIRTPDCSRGYKAEHVLVMEKSLGRKLTDKETVHHKNGMRADNRLENLELWAFNHSPGQRTEDLVSWAVSLLQQYAPEKLK